MAETGSTDGWYGEDCLEGDFTGYDLCHYDVQPWGIQLDTVTSPDDVVMNRTTLLTDTTANAGTITYLLFGNSDGSCWTWGNDPSYYAELGCEEW
jgi:hypothetical protein